MGYKVCTGTGNCVSASTILAIEDAVSPTTLTMQPKPIAHVINLSLGGAGNPDDATATAASNAALLGTAVVASAGNEGPGEGTIGSPSAGRHVISVAATTHPGAANSNWSVDVLQASAVPQNQTGGVTPAKNLPAASGFDRLKLYPMVGTPDPAANSVAQRYVLVNNPLVTYPAEVSGRIALIKNPGLASVTFFDTAANSAAAGAIGSATSAEFTNMGDGTRSYRIRSITPGRVGKFVTMPSNVESITVSRRMAIDASNEIAAVNKTIVFSPGVTDMTTVLKNESSTVFYPAARMEIVAIESKGNSVRVVNADNNGNGVTEPAAFDYSQLVGADFRPNEETATRAIKFSNPNMVLFVVTTRVVASVPAGSPESAGATSSGTIGGTSGGSTGGTPSGSGTNSTGRSALGGTRVFKFTLNPLTKTITPLQ